MLRCDPDRMNRAPDPASERRRAVTTRDIATRRLRRTTQLSIAATLLVGGVFASLAAGSTHFTKAVVRQTRKVATKTVVHAAPAPPLVAVQSQAAPVAPPQSVAPAATAQAPVVVSGGS
jgi:hypothetical protein